MRLKTYQGSDLAAALAKAHAEMGADALVLATQEISGRLGIPVVEVTVAAPRDEPAPGSPDPRVKRLTREIRNLRSRPQPEQAVEATASHTPSPFPPPLPVLQTAVEALIASGLSRDLAQRFANIAGRDLSRGADASEWARAAARGVEELVSFAPLPLHHRCLFVVGPPGCGKTTTAAKLAARVALPTRRTVFFGEADAERVGAFEQAEIYAKHLGAQIARINDVEDLQYAIRDAGEQGMVIVDTPGIGQGDEERREAVNELRRSVPDAAVALLVPAGLHRDEAARVLDRFAPLEPGVVGLSRLDDGLRPGELVTALAESRLPLAFITNGHSVPQDLEAVSPGGLAALLLRAGQRGSESPRV